MRENKPKGITYTLPIEDDLEAKERTKELLVKMVVDYIKNNSSNIRKSQKTG